MSYEAWRPHCAICQQSVDLTESKADEYGRAVHENCYVSMLVSKKPRPFTLRSNPPTRAAVATVPLMGRRPLRGGRPSALLCSLARRNDKFNE
jgi:hypothetical protein